MDDPVTFQEPEGRIPPGPRVFRSETLSSAMRVYLPSYAVSRLIGFGRGVLLAWVVASQEEFGLLQLSLLAINVFYPLMNLSLNEAMTRYVPHYEARHALRSFLWRAVTATLGITALIGVLFMFIAGPLGKVLFHASPGAAVRALEAGETRRLVWLILLTTFLIAANMMIQALLKGLRMFRAVSLIEVGTNTLYTVMALVFAWGGWNDARGLLGSYAVSLFIMVLLFALPLWNMIHRQTDQRAALDAGDLTFSRIVRQMTRFSVWLACAAVLWQAMHYLPVGYLQKSYGEKETATFTAVRHVTQAMLVVAVAVMNVVMPAVTRSWEAEGRQAADSQLKLLYKCFAMTVLGASVLLVLISGWVMRLFPAAYADGVTIFPLMLLFFLICGHLMFFTIHFHLIERTHHLIGAWAAGMLVAWMAGHQMMMTSAGGGEGLHRAAWVSLLAVGAALTVTVSLLLWERRPMDRGSLLVLGASFLLLLPKVILVIAFFGVVLVALVPGVFFDHGERVRISAQAGAIWRWLTQRFPNRSTDTHGGD